MKLTVLRLHSISGKLINEDGAVCEIRVGMGKIQVLGENLSLCCSVHQKSLVVVGGPGNSLDRNYSYSIEKDINYIAERTTNTNVESVNLFQRHDKLWMNGRVRSMKLRLDRALMRHDMSHIGIIDTASIAREDFTKHGLHLNS
jgi:hypothetical protein